MTEETIVDDSDRVRKPGAPSDTLRLRRRAVVPPSPPPQPPTRGPMGGGGGVEVFARRKFAKRARVVDVMAAGIILIVVYRLLVDAYALGFDVAGAQSAASVVRRDAAFVKMVLEAFIGVCCVAWLMVRALLSGGARNGS